MLNKKTKKIIVLTSIIGIITSLSFITPMISSPIYLSKKHCHETEILPVNNAQTKDNEAININNKINNTIDTTYADLEEHINTPPIYTMDEVDELIMNGIQVFNLSGKKLIQTDKFTTKLINKKYEFDSIELKSYIYHMMLNSIDYFNSSEGSMIYAINTSAPINIYFQTDISKKLSYETESQFGSIVNEFYHSDNILRCINSKTNRYTESLCATPLEWVISDNERVITLDNGESMKLNRNDLTNLGISGNSCLFPQSYATTYLSNFENWELGDTDELLGRTSIEIKGFNNNNTFKMNIDINTGALLNYEVYDVSGNISGYIKVNEISFDKDVTVYEFDEKNYEKEEELTFE